MSLLAAERPINSPGLPPQQAGLEEFYAPEAVQTIHLEISEENLQNLRAALPERIFVRGTFSWRGDTIQNVGIRYKGNSSSHPRADLKRSFLVKFSEFEPRQRFLGLRRVALDNGIQFGSLFSERLITGILRDLGVKASRCNYAKVYLNRDYLGVYVNVERIDESFLWNQFAATSGPLFKVSEGGPGADLHYLGDDRQTYRKTFDLESGDADDAYGRLIALIRSVDPPSPGEAPASLETVLDLDSFLKTTAVLLLAGAFDQYTGWNPHNYYLFQKPSDQRWVYLPWDLDVGFADHAFGQVPVIEGWNAAWPIPVPGRPLMERIVSDSVLLRCYREQANTILETHFRPEVLTAKLRALYGQIRPALAEDPYPPRRVTVPSDSGFEDILASMEQFIRDRYALARTQLDAPGDRPPPKPMPGGPEQKGPEPGPPSADAPGDLRAVKATSTSVELEWTDHAQGEVAFVVQRCTGAECTDFTNRIGQGGQDITTAIDRDVQPGKTYRYRVYAVRPTPQGPRGTGVSNTVTVTIPEDPRERK